MWTSLPLPARLLVAGLVAAVLLVIGAVAVRPSPYAALEEDAPPASASASTAAPPAALGLSSARPPTASGTAPAAAALPATPAPPPSNAARALRAELHKDLQLGAYPAATEALARLLEAEPRAAEDAEVRGDIVELSMRVTLLTGGEPDRVFSLIASGMGPAGIDILYELLTTRGGSRAATRAEELLRDDKLRARGTPTLRIAYDLRETHGCDEKKALFPRAASDGDGRTLGQLQLLNRRCGRRSAGCCLQNDPDLRQAMDGIKARSN